MIAEKNADQQGSVHPRYPQVHGDADIDSAPTS